MTKIVIAYYDEADQARQSGEELCKIGIAETNVGVMPANGFGGMLKEASSDAAFITELSRLGISKDEAQLYVKGVASGGGFVIARVEDEKAEEAADVLDRLPVVDIEARAEEWRREGGEQQLSNREGQTVQAVEEELQVGKRAVQAERVRIRSVVEETPVEERVRLHEEEVNVERSRAERTLSPEEAEKAFQEQTIEVTATREQPVVSKQARVVEEVSVSKTGREREEVIRDTVRRTKLEVEQDDKVRSAKVEVERGEKVKQDS